MEKHKNELEFKSGTNEILRLAIHSKDHGNVIGIHSPSLGAGVFITAVDKVLLDYETIIYLKPVDVNGFILPKNKLKLSEITSVCSFKSSFEQVTRKAPQENAMAGTYY